MSCEFIQKIKLTCDLEELELLLIGLPLCMEDGESVTIPGFFDVEFEKVGEGEITVTDLDPKYYVEFDGKLYSENLATVLDELRYAELELTVEDYPPAARPSEGLVKPNRVYKEQ